MSHHCKKSLSVSHPVKKKNKFFLKSTLDLPSFSFKSLLLALYRSWQKVSMFSISLLHLADLEAIMFPQSFLSSRLSHPNYLCLPSQERCSNILTIFVVPSGPDPTGSCHSCPGDPRPGYRWKWKGKISSPDLQATLLLMQPRIQLAFWTERAHCWLMSDFSSPSHVKRMKLSKSHQPDGSWHQEECWGKVELLYLLKDF